MSFTSKFEEIDAARRELGLPEEATMAEIKRRYRALMKKWHPDAGRAGQAECTEMSRRIEAAYRTIMEYCAGYRYRFTREEVDRYAAAEEWWMRRFGQDPVWNRSADNR
jgi:DnaJ-class molecular chaperone